MTKRKFNLGGPATLVAAAFIGPGTVTVCTLAGAGYGLELLWAVVISIILTILFQDMAARLGVITQMDLTSLIKQELKNPVIRFLLLAIVLSAIVIGNGAYEAGNISGGALGLETFLDLNFGKINFTPILIGLTAFILLWFGNYKVLEKSLVALVGLMGLSFLITAIMIKPNLHELLRGMLLPAIPNGGLLTVLGVIGTTIVPYNLFLHTSLSKTKWNKPEDLKAARKDTIGSILVGGLVSMAIVISASSLQGLAVENAVDLGKGLEPIYGSFAKYLISIGLFAAGITSAITAPLAAAYVAAGCFNLEADLKSRKFKITWILIILIGVIFSSIGFKPVDVIRFAQIANGLMLPVIGILLLWLCSKASVLGDHKNKTIITVISGIFVILIVILGAKSIWSVIF